MRVCSIVTYSRRKTDHQGPTTKRCKKRNLKVFSKQPRSHRRSRSKSKALLKKINYFQYPRKSSGSVMPSTGSWASTFSQIKNSPVLELICQRKSPPNQKRARRLRLTLTEKCPFHVSPKFEFIFASGRWVATYSVKWLSNQIDAITDHILIDCLVSYDGRRRRAS